MLAVIDITEHELMCNSVNYFSPGLAGGAAGPYSVPVYY
jgi:hypothetical protein